MSLKEMARSASGGEMGDMPQGGGGRGGDDMPADLDLKSLYNENRKLQRLLGKSQKDLDGLRTDFGGMQTGMKKFQALESIFKGEGGGDDDEAESYTIAQRAQRAHQRMLDLDPEASGIPLTVDIAGSAEEALRLVREQAKIIQQLQEGQQQFRNPQFTAEQQLFVNVESQLRDEVANLFEDAGLGDQNYPDFERVAIDFLKKKKQNTAEWRRFISSPTAQSAFVREVINSKIPRAYAKRGGSEVGSYSLDEAKKDLSKVAQMSSKTPQERAARTALEKKARQAILPHLLGLDFG